jgi:hypothetical protein
MEKELGIELQKQFNKLHRIIFPIAIIYFIIGRFVCDVEIEIWPSVFLLVFLLLEAIAFSLKKMVVPFLFLLRYMELAFACFFMLNSDNESRYGFYLILLFMFSMEYFFNFDFMEGYFRTVCLLSISIPMVTFILMDNILKKTIGIALLTDLCVCLMYVLVIAFIGELLTRAINGYAQKLFAQRRLIESVNETNEELRINQEKVKRANELLAVQKVKLETANRQIESANAQMQIQNQIMKYISSSLEIGKLMNLITESIEKEIGVDVCAIVLYPQTVENKDVQYKIKTHLNKNFEDR